MDKYHADEISVQGWTAGPTTAHGHKLIKQKMKRRGYRYLRTERNQFDRYDPARLYFVKIEEEASPPTGSASPSEPARPPDPLR